MSLEKYRQTIEATITPVEYIIRLHEQLLLGCEQLEQLQESSTKEERYDTLQKLQRLFLELLSMIDRTTEEGQRLFTAYFYCHQQVVEMRLSDTYDAVDVIKREILALLSAWEAYRYKMRKQRGKSGRI